MVTERKCLERRLGLTGDIQTDIEKLSAVQGRALSQDIKRTNRITSLSFVMRDILMPIFNNISDILMIIFLWRKEDKIFAYMTLTFFYLPAMFLLVHYFLHFRKTTNNFMMKLLIFSLVGPSMDWILNIALLLRNISLEDLDEKTKKFLDIIKVVNGVIESSLQLIWTTVLICLSVSPLPWDDITNMPDILGNTFPLPVSALSLLFSVISIINQLTFYWRSFGLKGKTKEKKGSEETGELTYEFLVYPLVITHLVFRVGVLAIVSLFANIYSVTLLGLNLISYSLIRLTRTCHEHDSVLGEAVASLANSLMLIPTSRDHGAHNLYIIHDAITNIFMMSFLIIIQIINFDYNNPLLTRPNTLIISHNAFIISILSIVTVFCLSYLCRFVFYYGNQRCKKPKFWKIKIKFTRMNIAKSLLILVNLAQVMSTVILAVLSFLLTSEKLASVSVGGPCGVWLQTPSNKSNIMPMSCQQSWELEQYMEDSTLERLLNETDCLARTFVPQSRSLYDDQDMSQDIDMKEVDEITSQSQGLNFQAVIIPMALILLISISWFLILMRDQIRKVLCKLL